MNYAKPEELGISSENILKYIKKLEEKHLIMHDVLIMRGGKLICEAYWKPFHKDFLHRMYSVTKSFIALAVGFLEQDGVISLDDKIAKYFPDEIKNQTDENMRNQTIRNMLMMATAKTERYWFTAKCADRVRYYFENDLPDSRPAGTIFQYDSSGTFVLGAMVERLTGKTVMEFLREKCLNKIGFSDKAYMLKCPGGHSWGDSALICKPSDLMKAAQFVMNNGKWEGEQLLNEEFVSAATSCLISNNALNGNEFNNQGYGYYFWRTFDNSFAFVGMGNQLAVCVPDKDIVFVCNADNQGKEYGYSTIVDNLFDMVVRPASDKPLPKNEKAEKELADYISSLTLYTAKGEKTAPVKDEINNKTYKMDKNPMGIEKLRFSFDENGGTMFYTNAQGDKELKFGICENAFGKFPQDGYADEVGTQKGNRRYDCAASAAWESESSLVLAVQIIDAYFGNVIMHFGFKDNEVGVFMVKAAEDFLEEYQGYAGGKY